MEFLQFAQQNGNPSVYSNKYTMQNTPVLTKFKSCDSQLSPDAQMAFLKNQTGQDILINNNPQKHQLLGVSDTFAGSMQQYQPIVTIPLQSSYIQQQQQKEVPQQQHLQYILWILIVVIIVIHAFIYIKMQKLEYRLKYQRENNSMIPLISSRIPLQDQQINDQCNNTRHHYMTYQGSNY